MKNRTTNKKTAEHANVPADLDCRAEGAALVAIDVRHGVSQHALVKAVVGVTD